MKIRRIGAAGAALTVLASLGGCTLDGAGGGRETGSRPDASDEVTGEVTLQTWALKPSFTEYVEGVIDDFEAEYPGATVTWLDQPGEGYSEKVLSQAAAGELPDVINLPPDGRRELHRPRAGGQPVAGGQDRPLAVHEHHAAVRPGPVGLQPVRDSTAAVALARFITGAANQEAFAAEVSGVFPSTSASQQDPELAESDGTPQGDAKQIAYRNLTTAWMLQPVEVDEAMTTIINPQFAAAIAGDKTSRDALDAAVEECNKLLADQ